MIPRLQMPSPEQRSCTPGLWVYGFSSQGLGFRYTRLTQTGSMPMAGTFLDSKHIPSTNAPDPLDHVRNLLAVQQQEATPWERTPGAGLVKEHVVEILSLYAWLLSAT